MALPTWAGWCWWVQIHSPECLHSPHALLLPAMRTHMGISLLPNHAPASTHLSIPPPPAGWMKHPIRGPILPETDITDTGRQCFQWSVWLSLQHATDTMSYFSMEHSHARLWSEVWGERRELRIKLAKMWRGGKRGKPGVMQDHPHYWTSTGCPVPNPSLAVWVPGTRFPRGQSYSCNALHGAELRMGPSLAVVSIPTSASAKKVKDTRSYNRTVPSSTMAPLAIFKRLGTTAPDLSLEPRGFCSEGDDQED